MFIFGGRSGGKRLGDFWMLDTDIWQWSELTGFGDLPSPWEFAAASAIGNRKFVMYGGWDGKKWLSDVYIMDTNSDLTDLQNPSKNPGELGASVTPTPAPPHLPDLQIPPRVRAAHPSTAPRGEMLRLRAFRPTCDKVIYELKAGGVERAEIRKESPLRPSGGEEEANPSLGNAGVTSETGRSRNDSVEHLVVKQTKKSVIGLHGGALLGFGGSGSSFASDDPFSSKEGPPQNFQLYRLFG
ncbi:hypothetical protein E2562_036139 [Oryza meyeriana var. granulata]|uniref:Galactose oxidase/kelch repeat superfamily protein n=1 Tax=Oryza meyeriana var. granulata TaxID=110450 RepID=A0A6G1E7V1_9ORYZ|nr:hypothetical protein E2562_036139 [Oryza meyeriana var. granulata]